VVNFISAADKAIDQALTANGFHRVATESRGTGVVEYTYFNKAQIMVKINYVFSSDKPDVDTSTETDTGSLF